jgi:multiple sugar transport system permease protein
MSVGALQEVLTPIAPRARRRARALPRPLVPYALLAPAAALLAAFVVVPALLAFALALYDWDVLAGVTTFVGLDNYARVLGSHELLNAVKNTLLYALMTVPTTLGLGLAVALAIDALAHGRAFWRAVYFLPVASTLVAMAVVWRWLFYPESGFVDVVLGGLAGVDGWLTSTSLALPALAVVGNWQGVGFAAVIFLAGLSGVPRHLLEAARLDGAGAWQRFRHVLVPALGPATVFAAIIATTSALRVFEQVQVMTEGDPLGSTETLTFLLWRRGIDYLDLGGGAVVTVVLFVVVLAFTAGQLRTFGRRLEEAGSR